MTSQVRRRLAVAASVATILGLGVAIWALAGGDSNPAEETSSSDNDRNSVDAGDAKCVIVSQGDQSNVSVNCGEIEASTDSVTDWENLRDAQPWREARSPSGAGPWPFVIGGTGGEGLYIRDGFLQDDRRLRGDPTLADGTTVYAYCQETSGWEAVPGYGATWHNVGYPQPPNHGDKWIYAWWTAPVEHDGNIPDCQG
jgi:hypothetical protein